MLFSICYCSWMHWERDRSKPTVWLMYGFCCVWDNINIKESNTYPIRVVFLYFRKLAEVLNICGISCWTDPLAPWGIPSSTVQHDWEEALRLNSFLDSCLHHNLGSFRNYWICADEEHSVSIMATSICNIPGVKSIPQHFINTVLFWSPALCGVYSYLQPFSFNSMQVVLQICLV